MLKPLHPILTVAVPPHVHCGRSIRRYMLDTVTALLPAVIMAVAVFGLDALRVMALSCAVAVATEALCNKLTKREQSVDDFSGLLTGLLFAFLLPASAPWWLVAIGAFFSITFGKMIFGGLGANPLSSPLIGWAICRISWADVMDTNATMLMSDMAAPLQQLKYFGLNAIGSINYSDLLLGHQLGGLGEIHGAALLIGGAYLLLRRHITWEIPTGFIAGLLLTAWIYQLIDPAAYAPPLFHLLAGGAIFGAFFLATDAASTPVGRIPSILFGLITGTMVIIIRVYGIYPDGVPFAILLANLFTPLLDRIRPKPFGGPYSFSNSTEGA
ncbi:MULTISPECIES: RnfABCDGE type electron transport complex subunit D [unclassified Pseudodesulfovibrio]|uniref:RnfABCDGE type electron transport complex subunit D n=1 Tax=unclassified Pseudodesulfovibrio TaxID=2661612 RepID=UPI000FEBA3A5|nr:MULTISPECIES: RnfABCDGE type electron transport complex subunit D [unclassified Pseudodesulfovibrio]MCJ2164056.1 RnfABCDGE type electron transport complex subunit D [Pseudodesulfovibrio sp. S3-i]RWU05310.1 RnfABCDGE type electron transport complex subunit D [Pseudodesulfovibrio sp. S3]